MKRSPLKRRSKKKQVQDVEYTKLRRTFLLQHPVCEIFENESATQVHHKKGRGIHYLDPSSWMAVSDRGHKFIHDNPKIAKEKGWLIYGPNAK